jgi:hypothetical protein
MQEITHDLACVPKVNEILTKTFDVGKSPETEIAKKRKSYALRSSSDTTQDSKKQKRD